MGSNSGVALAVGTGVAVNVGVKVDAEIVEEAMGRGEASIGACVPPQPVTNKPTNAKSTNIFLIEIRSFSDPSSYGPN